MGSSISSVTSYVLPQNPEDVSDTDANTLASNADTDGNAGTSDIIDNVAPSASAPASAPAPAPASASSPASTSPAGMSADAAGQEFIQHNEARYLTAYQHKGDVPTIGYGHTGDVNGKPIVAGKTPTKINLAQAKALFRGDLSTAENAVRSQVKVPLTQGQFNALTDYTFNAGANSLKGTNLLKNLNAGDYAGAQKELTAGWDGKPQLSRRQAEAVMFGNQGPQGASGQ